MEKITVEKLSKLTGISGQELRARMKSGNLNIATSKVSKNGVTTWIFSPQKIYEELGVKVNGYEPPQSIEIKDLDIFAEKVAENLLQKMIIAFGGATNEGRKTN